MSIGNFTCIFSSDVKCKYDEETLIGQSVKNNFNILVYFQ
jgi:hypothetical protein